MTFYLFKVNIVWEVFWVIIKYTLDNILIYIYIYIYILDTYTQYIHQHLLNVHCNDCSIAYY